MVDYLKELFGLSDRTAVVIGGTGVLCGRMGHALAAAGARVVVAGLNSTKGAERVAAIEAEGGHARYFRVDTTQRDSIQELCDVVLREMGQVDILINGAGINRGVPYFAMDDEADWDRVFATNMRGLHQSCQIFAKPMTERGCGSIINIGSVSAGTPLSKVFAYAASKAAVINYTQNLARELAPMGVRVNSLSPGFFPAEQNRAILDEQRVAKIMARTPMARFGDPRELDGALLLLASDRAGAFITGANYIVDGGFTAMAF